MSEQVVFFLRQVRRSICYGSGVMHPERCLTRGDVAIFCPVTVSYGACNGVVPIVWKCDFGVIRGPGSSGQRGSTYTERG